MPKIIQNLPEKLIEETRRQVMDVGYTALNIRDIARNCGVGIGTVYNYFPSKDALIAQFLLQDWKESLDRIHLSVGERGDTEAVCAAVYRELTAFYSRYADLFHAAETVIPAPPRKYHGILGDQIAQVFRPLCDDDFTADFTAEAMLTWSVAGIPFDQLFGLLKKILHNNATGSN